MAVRFRAWQRRQVRDSVRVSEVSCLEHTPGGSTNVAETSNQPAKSDEQLGGTTSSSKERPAAWISKAKEIRDFDENLAAIIEKAIGNVEEVAVGILAEAGVDVLQV